mmetsp:Transcript_25435/g.39225  ORF Transcript_25435/g.39225 Transcript_25435/m.39225 type:complete len:140 (+) Transcript_25435:1830-2249(+)
MCSKSVSSQSDSSIDGGEDASLARKYGLSNEGSLADYDENKEQPSAPKRVYRMQKTIGENRRIKLHKKFKQMRTLTKNKLNHQKKHKLGQLSKELQSKSSQHPSSFHNVSKQIQEVLSAKKPQADALMQVFESHQINEL